MVVVIASWAFRVPLPRWLQAVGAIVAVAGAVYAAWAMRALGRSLTPMPDPREGSALVTRGPYRSARHPIYGGGIVFFAGLSLVFNPYALAGVLGLAALWLRKSRYEEELLEARHPAYGEYRRSVAGRFLPGL
jgi:protein-S-isoprenylcysteine O-methyltransferase Ste14